MYLDTWYLIHFLYHWYSATLAPRQPGWQNHWQKTSFCCAEGNNARCDTASSDWQSWYSDDCSSYPIILELETAMANQVQQQSSVIPSCISHIGNEVCVISGGITLTSTTKCHLAQGTPRSGTHGIVVYRKLPTLPCWQMNHLYREKKKRTFKYVPLLGSVPNSISPCYVQQREGGTCIALRT